MSILPLKHTPRGIDLWISCDILISKAMPNIFSNSYAVFKESLHILREDKKMFIFPVVAGIMCLAATAGFALFTVLVIEPFVLIALLSIFIWYLFMYFLCIFFSSAMVIYAYLQIKGEKRSVITAIMAAGKNSYNILAWSLFSATIGIVLELIDKLVGERFSFLTAFLGMAWSLATFFVIPAMVFEKKTPICAMKESAALFKKRWGETITGTVGIGGLLMLIGLAGLLVFVGIIQILPETIFLSIFLFIIFVGWLVLLNNTLNSIYVASLYYFAVTGEVKGGFSETTIRNAAL